jgi:hypothetical protein
MKEFNIFPKNTIFTNDLKFDDTQLNEFLTSLFKEIEEIKQK